MDCKFQVGDEVVCVRAPTCYYEGSETSSAGPDPVEVDKVYKITGIEADDYPPFPGDPFLFLAEKPTDCRYHYSLFRKVEKPLAEHLATSRLTGPEFEQDQFRRLKPHKTVTVKPERVG